jgi:hypothetical protein
MVIWDPVTRDEVMRAMQEYDQLGPEAFFAAHGFAPTTTLTWSGRNAVTRRRPSSALLMSSPRETAWPPVISRAARPAP